MRGFLHPAVQHTANETQKTFSALPRGRRTKLAKAASTTLVKADQWGNGKAVSADVGEALERAVTALGKKTKK